MFFQATHVNRATSCVRCLTCNTPQSPRFWHLGAFFLSCKTPRILSNHNKLNFCLVLIPLREKKQKATINKKTITFVVVITHSIVSQNTLKCMPGHVLLFDYWLKTCFFFAPLSFIQHVSGSSPSGWVWRASPEVFGNFRWRFLAGSTCRHSGCVPFDRKASSEVLLSQ